MCLVFVASPKFQDPCSPRSSHHSGGCGSPTCPWFLSPSSSEVCWFRDRLRRAAGGGSRQRSGSEHGPLPGSPYAAGGGGAGGLALALTPALCWFRGAHLPLACGPPFFWKSGWCLQGPEKCLLGKQVNRVQLHVCRVETGPHLESVNSDYLKNSRNTRVVQQREG